MLNYLKEFQYQRIKLEVKSSILGLLPKVITPESLTPASPAFSMPEKWGF